MKYSPRGSIALRNNVTSLFAAAICLLGASSAEAAAVKAAPLNPAFAAWRDGKVPLPKSGDFVPGFVPLPWKQIQFKYDPASSGQKALPTSFDLRGLGDLTGVRDQGLCGSCWTFGAYASAESWLLKNLGETWDFSENHLKNYAGFDPGPCEGGNYSMVCAYLARGSGPVLESSDPYHEYDDRPSPGGSQRKTLESFLRFHTADTIKQALMDHGALSTMLWWDSKYYNSADSTYYYTTPEYNGELDANHAVAIVGWNDAKVVTGGPQANPAPGAWIVKNSWDDSWGDGGFFYISYYDTNAVVPVGGAYAFADLAPASKYGRIYQYDTLGVCTMLGYENDICWGANVFTAQASENLVAVSFYTVGPDTNYQLYVYDTFNGTSFSSLLSSKSGLLANEGYHTVTLNSAVPLVAGDQFALVVRLVTPGAGGYPLPVEYALGGYSSRAVAHSGESYCSDNGTDWESLGTEYNVCLKGFTEGVPATTVTPPLFDPAPGVYSIPVALSCETSGATIRFSLDNTEPTETSTAYSSPIAITATTTIRAKAFKDGMTPSATTSGTYTISTPADFCDAAEYCAFDWTTGGDSDWFAQSVTTHDGTDALRSGNVNDEGVSWVETTVNGPGQLSFWWKVSSEEGWDELALHLNHDYVRGISGSVDWQFVAISLPAGPQTITWLYIKDEASSEGEDCGWLDQVSHTVFGEIAVEDSAAPADDRLVPFGFTPVGLSKSEQVIIRNTDPAHDLTVSSICVAQCYSEDFDSGAALDWLPTIPSEWAVASGRYRAQHAGVEAVMQSMYDGQTWTDCAYQATVSRSGAPACAAVLVARATEDFDAGNIDSAGSAYMAGVDGTGLYYVARMINGVFEFLCGWTVSPHLNTGSTPNTVLLNVVGASIDLYLNGVLVWSGTDTSISGPGRIGVWCYTRPDLATTHFFDDILVCGPMTPGKASLGAVQQWYNQNPVVGGTPSESPSGAVPLCPFTDVEGAAPVVLGADADYFELAGLPVLPAVIPPGGAMAFDVTYTPGFPGDHAAPLTIQSNDQSEPRVTVTLTGLATAEDLPAAGAGALAMLAAAILIGAMRRCRRVP